MNSSFESLSIELLFELFDYLSPFDLFRIFINLNNRLNAIVYSYPLRLDFRSICRSKFDFICRHLQPKQVISLILCDEYVPDRVKLFLNHFPHFKEQFLQLQSITLIEAETITFIDLPASVSSLSIRIYDVDDYYYENYISKILSQQAKVLTHLKIDSKDLYDLIDIHFPALTYLIISGGYYYDGNYIDVSVLLENIDVHSLIQQWQCFLTHLYLVIDNKIQYSTFNLDRFSHCLTHLTLHFYQEPFRSLFWLEQRHWYVGCYQDETEKGTIIYSIPRFQTRTLKYPSAKFPHMTTAPSIIEQNFFYSSRINYFSFDMNKLITPVDYRFHQVKSLTLSGSSLLSLNILSSIVDLQQVQYLDVSNINRLLPNELENLIAHTPRVVHLSMKFDPLFIIPSQIRYLLLDGLGRSISLDRLSYTISSVERLEISVASKQMIIDVIDRFNGLENLDTYFDDGDLDDDCMTIYKGVSIDWLIKHTHRLKSYDFTCRYSREFYPSIYLSFGDRRKENDHQD
ncbi:unnamed protein product [Rotaria sordida]|uniref:F-box domain-containing protein n=1 Tax=Rotaria sordida TaxID=392033 RepID=A0A815VAN8_9BILA|nr:unnamed protein product [Rotaria sordida]CAF1528021.1 unnamed protein product [Rotaria sordida]